MAKLICVDPAYVHQMWPVVSERIKRAIERGYISFHKIEQDVLDGKLLLWLVIDGTLIRAAVVTGLFGGDCEIVALGGEGMAEWVHLISGIEDYARAEQCKKTRIIGRPGWRRVLKDYKQTSVVLEKVL